MQPRPYQGDDDDIPPGVFDSFSHYEKDFGKTYDTPAERSYRLHVFYKNFLFIGVSIVLYSQDFYDDEEVTYFLEYTPFSDRTDYEYFYLYLIRTTPPVYAEQAELLDVSNLAASVDWRTKGIVSEVRDQGECGSQWAFSTVAVLESFFRQSGATKANLSEQQLLDCSNDGKFNDGCNGGWPNVALKWVQQSMITTAADYPYVGKKQNNCKKDIGSFRPNGYKVVAKDTTGDQLKAAVAIRPVSVCFDASNLAFYKGGPVNKNCDGTANHCGLLVGYNDDDGWIVKSSWGSLWGDEGYINIEMGNTCGITQHAIYPI